VKWKIIGNKEGFSVILHEYSCENWEHKKCCKLSGADYKKLNRDAIPWYCTVCKRSMEEMPKQLKEKEMELKELKLKYAELEEIKNLAENTVKELNEDLHARNGDLENTKKVLENKIAQLRESPTTMLPLMTKSLSSPSSKVLQIQKW
jgi:hypothetical protein